MLHISSIDNCQEEEMSKNNALVQQHAQQEIDMKKQVKLLSSDKFADITWAGNSQIINSYFFFLFSSKRIACCSTKKIR